MSATTAQLNALANDGTFRARVRNLVLQEAAVVYAESGATTGHAARSAYAISLVQTPSKADELAKVIVTRTNLVASNITYDWERQIVLTDATDASILSQIAADWNLLAGV
jgi:hypothetical protein